MIKISLSAMLLLGLTSCVFRNLEGRPKAVTFTVDHALNQDIPAKKLTYNNAKFLEGSGPLDVVEFRKGLTDQALIYEPTIFRDEDAEFLVYPGERIGIKTQGGNDSLFSIDGNAVRDRELQVLKRFHELEKIPDVPSGQHYDLATISQLEQEQKEKIRKAETASQALLDSLEKQYQVSEQFRQLTSNYIKGRYGLGLTWIYKENKDTLLAYGLYRQKFKELVPAVNVIRQRQDFNSNIRFMMNDIWFQLFPGKSLLSFNEEGFRAAFDSAKNTFTGPARENLLSRILYVAYKRGVPVPRHYAKAYRRYCKDKVYRSIVRNAKKQRLKEDKETASVEKGNPTK
jgi:hypothetical protein